MPGARTSQGPIEYRLTGSGPVVMVLKGGHSSRSTRLGRSSFHRFQDEIPVSKLSADQPNVKQYTSTPASRNSISNRRSAIGPAWRMS
jgi:hypothetical protein